MASRQFNNKRINSRADNAEQTFRPISVYVVPSVQDFGYVYAIASHVAYRRSPMASAQPTQTNPDNRITTYASGSYNINNVVTHNRWLSGSVAQITGSYFDYKSLKQVSDFNGFGIMTDVRIICIDPISTNPNEVRFSNNETRITNEPDSTAVTTAAYTSSSFGDKYTSISNLQTYRDSIKSYNICDSDEYAMLLRDYGVYNQSCADLRPSAFVEAPLPTDIQPEYEPSNQKPNLILTGSSADEMFNISSRIQVLSGDFEDNLQVFVIVRRAGTYLVKQSEES